MNVESLYWMRWSYLGFEQAEVKIVWTNEFAPQYVIQIFATNLVPVSLRPSSQQTCLIVTALLGLYPILKCSRKEVRTKEKRRLLFLNN